MSIITPALSKAVGWTPPYDLFFPSPDEVRKASHIQLLQWYRFLSSPATDEHRNILNLICERVKNEEPIEHNFQTDTREVTC